MSREKTAAIHSQVSSRLQLSILAGSSVCTLFQLPGWRNLSILCQKAKIRQMSLKHGLSKIFGVVCARKSMRMVERLKPRKSLLPGSNPSCQHSTKILWSPL